MKRIFKFFMYSAMAVAVVASCTKDPVTEGSGNNEGGNNEGGNNEGGTTEKVDPTKETQEFAATPVGDTLVLTFSAEAAWTITSEDECDWVTVDPMSGAAGDSLTVNFYISANASRAREVYFYVNQEATETLNAGEIYEVFIAQSKMELPILEDDLAFLQYIVDNKGYGDATPVITDWYGFTGEGFPGISFGLSAANKLFIEQIYVYTSDAEAGRSMIFNSFPPTVKLANIKQIYINYSPIAGGMDITACPLIGSEFPSEWDCPALERVHLECVGMVGQITESFAALPSLRGFFVRSCDFYGALPHNWASGKMESIVLGFNGAADCPNLGYMVPKTFDIVLNSEKIQDGFHNDRNEYKVGGSRENWLGFEAGWGQKRYELFDPAAVKGDLNTWSEFRHISKAASADEIENGGVRNPNNESDIKFIDSWESYYGNIKDIPRDMLDWDQDAADAYTEVAAAKARLYTR